jgi:hypothetical protein
MEHETLDEAATYAAARIAHIEDAGLETGLVEGVRT